MGHKKDSLERWLSKITLAQTCYGHFYIEHNRGHHVRVATPEDPGVGPLRRDVLGVPAAQRVGQPALVVAAGGPAAAPGRTRARGTAVQRRAQRLGDVGGALRRADRGVRRRRSFPFVVISGGVRLRAAGDRQLPGALRAAAAEDGQRPLRALRAGAQLELRPHRHQPVPLPPAAAQRSPRQPDPALPDAAQHGRARRTCPAGTRR